MKPLADFSFKIAAYNKIMQRLKIGLLIGEMTDHMVLKSHGKLSPDRKIWMYSAHDDTVANLLMALNLFYPHCPPYAATVLIELRTNLINEFLVTISYKNTSGEPSLLTLPGCTPSCPLDDFIRLTKDVVPTDLERECLIGSLDNQNILSSNQNGYRSFDNGVNIPMVLGKLNMQCLFCYSYFVLLIILFFQEC